jgi:hypothetical protein
MCGPGGELVSRPIRHSPGQPGRVPSGGELSGAGPVLRWKSQGAGFETRAAHEKGPGRRDIRPHCPDRSCLTKILTRIVTIRCVRRGSRCEQAGARPTAGPLGASDRRRPRPAHRPAPAEGLERATLGGYRRVAENQIAPALGVRRIAKVTTNHQHRTITLSPPSRPMGLRGRLRAAAAPDRRRSAPGSVGGRRRAHRQAVSLRWAGAEAPAGVPRRPPTSARSGIPW